MLEIPSSDECSADSGFKPLLSNIHTKLRTIPDSDVDRFKLHSDHEEAFFDAFTPNHVIPGLGITREREEKGDLRIFIEGYMQQGDGGQLEFATTGDEISAIAINVPNSVSRTVYRSLEHECQVLWMKYAYALRKEGLSEKYMRMMRTGKGNALMIQDRIYKLEDAYARQIEELLATGNS